MTTVTRAAEAMGLSAIPAVLDVLGPLVFSGGSGENHPSIRARIGETLGYLGINWDETRDGEQAPLRPFN